MRMWRNCGILAQFWWDYKMVRLPWETVWHFLQKFKIRLSYDPVIPLAYTQKN